MSETIENSCPLCSHLEHDNKRRIFHKINDDLDLYACDKCGGVYSFKHAGLVDRLAWEKTKMDEEYIMQLIEPWERFDKFLIEESEKIHKMRRQIEEVDEDEQAILLRQKESTATKRYREIKDKYIDKYSEYKSIIKKYYDNYDWEDEDVKAIIALGKVELD